MCDCQPVVHPPQYCVHDTYTFRTVTHVHPVIHINRQNIVNVPQHVYQPITRNMVVDPGCPGRGSECPGSRMNR
jgi:Inner spore coat protein D.